LARTVPVKATWDDAGRMPDLLDLAKARKELEAKDLPAIERETALTWGGRAAASYGFVLEEEDHAEAMRCFWEGETYRGEAIEHAAMTEDARFLERLTVEIEGHRAKARDLLLAAGHEFVQGGRTPKASRPTPQSGRAQRLAARPQPAPAQAPAELAWETVEDEPETARPPASAPAAASKPLPKAEKATSVPRPPPATPGLGRRPENENRLS
jgi:hypothetical protein